MEQANTNSKPAHLPLFRAEALAARQQGTKGEILLIRPISLVLLGWLGVGLAASALGFLFLGKYAPTTKIEATITGATPMSGGTSALELAISNPQLTALRPGQEIRVRCIGCVTSLTGTVISISFDPPVSAAAGANHVASAVMIALRQNTELTSGTKVQAEIQLEKRPLIVWLLGKPGT